MPRHTLFGVQVYRLGLGGSWDTAAGGEVDAPGAEAGEKDAGCVVKHKAIGKRKWLCYDCGLVIEGEVVWLGEYEPEPFAHPFHYVCADQAWPLYEIAADDVEKDACTEPVKGV